MQGLELTFSTFCLSACDKCKQNFKTVTCPNRNSTCPGQWLTLSCCNVVSVDTWGTEVLLSYPPEYERSQSVHILLKKKSDPHPVYSPATVCYICILLSSLLSQIEGCDIVLFLCVWTSFAGFYVYIENANV